MINCDNIEQTLEREQRKTLDGPLFIPEIYQRNIYITLDI